MTRPLYQIIAHLLQAIEYCNKNNNHEWAEQHRANIVELVEAHMPSGSGFDAGFSLMFSESTPEKLMFKTEFHHMDENGYYTGWTHHVVTVKPSLVHEFTITISGRNTNNIKAYISELLYAVLKNEYDDITMEAAV